jgi:hypothetical protein
MKNVIALRKGLMEAASDGGRLVGVMVKDGKELLKVDETNGLPMKKQTMDEAGTQCGVATGEVTRPEGTGT